MPSGRAWNACYSCASFGPCAKERQWPAWPACSAAPKALSCPTRVSRGESAALEASQRPLVVFAFFVDFPEEAAGLPDFALPLMGFDPALPLALPA